MENYYEAAIRHFIDGNILKQADCWDNAVCLYGNSAECALKSLMEVYCGVENKQILQYKYGHDGETLNSDLYGFVTNTSITPVLDPILALKLQMFNLPEILFKDHPDRRYDKNGRFSIVDAALCKKATEFLIKELIMQHLDGYILNVGNC